MIRKCRYCGSYYDAPIASSVTCGRELCDKLYKRACRDKLMQESKSRSLEKRIKNNSLLRDAKAAKDLGVSYGYYMAFHKGRNVV